ncbi:MAG: YigZ family protein [Porphyromonas sp.]|nr:YigZ family protein [Porphyromonas sp.]
MTSYKTILKPAEGTFTEKRSKFISFAIPVSSPEEALEQVAKLRKEYFDARHVCWAYVVGTRTRQERANDDGEPSSTAGKPILGQIHSAELTNVLVAVVRYFGGIKLGTGGLIVAYKEAAKEAIDAAEIVSIDLTRRYKVSFGFDDINTIMRVAKTYSAETVETESSLSGYCWTFSVKEDLAASFFDEISSLYFAKIEEIETE